MLRLYCFSGFDKHRQIHWDQLTFDAATVHAQVLSLHPTADAIWLCYTTDQDGVGLVRYGKTPSEGATLIWLSSADPTATALRLVRGYDAGLANVVLMAAAHVTEVPGRPGFQPNQLN